MSRQALLLSNTMLYKQQRLGFAKDAIHDFMQRNNSKEILFIPYALKDYDAYTTLMGDAFRAIGFDLKGIHTFPCAKEAVEKARVIYIGGGNTFKLLKTLYDEGLVELIRNRVLEGKLAYMGASAGTNVATASIHTTNDMPIVHPPTFDAINIVPFNINPHYVASDPASTHMGETRDERIHEFLGMGYGRTVIGLYEGSLLDIDGDKITVRGAKGGKIFQEGTEGPVADIEVGQDLSHLLK